MEGSSIGGGIITAPMVVVYVSKTPSLRESALSERIEKGAFPPSELTVLSSYGSYGLHGQAGRVRLCRRLQDDTVR